MHPTSFLDHLEPRNSKSFYYTRLCIFHSIPYVVENQFYVKEVHELSKKINHNLTPPVMDARKGLKPSDIWDLSMTSNRIIADNNKIRLMFEHIDPCGNFWLDDDHIRNLILTDFAEGRGHYYDSEIPVDFLEFYS